MTHDPTPQPRNRTIRLLVEYDGAPFLGWQVQPQGPTVQAALQEAVATITGEQVTVRGSGRTDTGVHALGQVATFRTTARLEPDTFRRALNSALPPPIAILAADEVSGEFDPRFSALGKTYRYLVINRCSRSPIAAGRAWHIHSLLDIESMEHCCRIILGNNDFTSFRASGCAAADPVRNLRSCTVARAVENITFELEANGFLRHMVRNIVGTIVQVGLGRFSTADFQEILDARDRTRAGVTAPPWGLYLVRVDYPEHFGSPGIPALPGRGSTGPPGGETPCVGPPERITRPRETDSP